MNVNNPPVRQQANKPWIRTTVFVVLWLVSALVVAVIQFGTMGLLAWGAADNGHASRPLYPIAESGASLMFAVTQLATLVGGILVIRQRVAGGQLFLLLLGLYSLWLVSLVLFFIFA